MNPYAVAAALLGLWAVAAVPAALSLGAVIHHRDRQDHR